MRYKGNPVSTREYRVVTLPRENSEPISLRVTALPIGVQRMYSQLIRRPKPPVTVKLGKDGGEKQNWDDPTFEALWEEYKDLERYYWIWLAIKDTPELIFDSCAATEEITADKLRNFAKEMQGSGFTAGDLLIITKAAQDAGNMSAESIKESEKSF